jgi:hypothetical protein
MKNIALELPPGVFTDRETQLLNERLGIIQRELGVAEELRDNLDAKGKKIVNLGDATSAQDALNMRVADSRFSSSGGSGNTTPGGGGSSSSTSTVDPGTFLILSVPGTLAIDANVAPVFTLPKARSVSEILAFVKVAPAGGALTLKLEVGTRQYATVQVVDGQTSGRLNGAALGEMPANQLVMLNITSVGLNFPGSDLTLMVRFK